MAADSFLHGILGDLKARVKDRLGSVDLPVPQFVVVGPQASGKSRLVEALAGEHFSVSGAFGSRRPTVVEFCNKESLEESASTWSYWDAEAAEWQPRPPDEVRRIVAAAHTSLGAGMSDQPVHIRVEAKGCGDMRVVDLPGYRNFARDDAAQLVASRIEAMNGAFLRDPNNLVLCVEEAGDAANLSALRRVAEVDPEFKRSVLIRSKLDKYYEDLTATSVTRWLEGMGDLPKALRKFALTLPHWPERSGPPRAVNQLCRDAALQDVGKLKALGAAKTWLDSVGFNNFATHVAKKAEQMFAEGMRPVVKKLQDLEGSMAQEHTRLEAELEGTDPTKVLANVRACGMSFARGLSDVMGGVIRSDLHRLSLDEELKEFSRHCIFNGVVDKSFLLPSDDFGSLDEYVEYLRDRLRVPAFETQVNGGAQYRRLLAELETFVRFSELSSELGQQLKKRDVMQACGVSVGEVSWQSVLRKLLCKQAHFSLRQRIHYVSKRLEWFFLQQKDVVVKLMLSMRGPSEQFYSKLYKKHGKCIQEDPTIKRLVFQAYGNAVQRQLDLFRQVFDSTLRATFVGPELLLKRTPVPLEDMACVSFVPGFEDTKRRVVKEIGDRGNMAQKVSRWIAQVPHDPKQVDVAVDTMQLIMQKMFCHVRSQVCDQLELFCESFFKWPLLLHLDEDMNSIELAAEDFQMYEARRKVLQESVDANASGLKEVRESLRILTTFQTESLSLSV